MNAQLEKFAQENALVLPPELEAVAGLDLGTVRFLSVEEIVEDRARSFLSPTLLPIAEGGQKDAFALYVPTDGEIRPRFVCAVNLETGVYAPIATSLKGFAAYLLVLRRAQASLPGGPGFDLSAFMKDTDDAARALAKTFGLESLVLRTVIPEAPSMADALLEFDPSSPWACSTLARFEENPMAALKRLAPALTQVSFAAGLMEQAGDLLLTEGQTKRAVNSIAGALQRLEPNLQTAPYKLDEPDEETNALFEPVYVGAAFRFLQENVKDVSAKVKASATWGYLDQVMGGGFSCHFDANAENATDYARRRTFAGDPEGGRWALHLAYGEKLVDPDQRKLLAAELASAWNLARRPWFERTFQRLAR